MKLVNVVPKMEVSFGVLEYAGKKEDVMGRIGGQRKITGRKYHLFSEKQPADDIEVVLPVALPEKKFGYEDKVVLVKPILDVEGEKIGDSGHANYILYAEDMRKA